MDDTKAETRTARLVKLSTLGLSHRLSTAVLYSSRFSVYPGPLNCLELTSAQAFILALYRSFLIGDAPAVFSLLPLVPQLPQLQSSSIAVWFREDFLFKRLDVTRALSWLAHFVKKEGPVIPLYILLVFNSLEEKYQVFSHFKEVGDTVGQEMLIYLNPLITMAPQARLQDFKNQSVDARPEMVTKGTQTNMTIKQEAFRSAPLTGSIPKDLPVLYATYQNVESIQTETIFEVGSERCISEPNIFKESLTTITTSLQQPQELLTFLVRSPANDRQKYSKRPRSLQPNEKLVADKTSASKNIPNIAVRPPTQEMRRSERPRSLQPTEVYSLEEAQRYATTSRIRPCSSIEVLTTDNERKHDPMFRARSNSTLEPSKNYSTLKRNIATAKAEATKKLMKAAEQGDTITAVAALAEGANVDQRDTLRRTPLHLAVVGGNEELVKRLIEAGADKDKKDSMGRTPLHYTALRGRVGCAQLLIDRGADPNPRDSSGLTPMALASMKHHSGITTILKKKGGQDCSIS